MKGMIQSVEVSCFVHATEDGARIEEALTKVLGLQVAPETELMEGHFGNPIRRLKFHVTGDEAERMAAGLLAGMPREAKEQVLRDLDSAVDEHSALYLRLDKQAAVEGRLALGGKDPVRVRVKPRLHELKGGAKDLYTAMMADA